MLELRRNLAHLLLGTFFAFLVVSLPHELVIVGNMVLIGGLFVSSFLYQRYNIAFLAWLFARFDRPGQFTAKGAILFFCRDANSRVALLTPICGAKHSRAVYR